MNNSELQEMIEERRKQREQLRDEGGKFYKKTVSDYVAECGLDTSDMRVRQLLSQQDDIENPEQEVLQLANKMRGPSEADMPSVVSGMARNPKGDEALWNEYSKRLKTTPRNMIPQLKIEFRKRGLRNLY